MGRMIVRPAAASLAGAVRRRPGGVLCAAVLLWLAGFAARMRLLYLGQQVTTPYRVYLRAARNFQAHKPLYQLKNVDGFQYLPQAAIAAIPIVWLGSPLGEIVWRAIGWGLYAYGLWRVCRLLAPTEPQLCFLLATGLALGGSISSVGVGQLNLFVAALSLHVVVDVVGRRWWRASGLLALGIGLKPLMIVLALLLWALYRPVLWRFPLAVALVLLAPLLVTDRQYLLHQYHLFAIKASISARPERMFEDVRGLLTSVGLRISDSTYRIMGLVGALGTFAICARARWRLTGPQAALFIAGFAAAYLALLNPRTQSNSYVIPVCIAAALAATYLLQKRARMGLAMSAVCGAWAANVYAWGELFRYWVKPLACIAFVGLLVRETLAADGKSAGT